MSDHRLPQWNAPAAGNEPGPPTSRSVWRAAASFGRLTGLVLIGIAVVIAFISLWRFDASGGSARTLWLVLCVLMIALAAIAAWLLHGLTTLRYILDEDRLTVIWMREQRVIPLADIIEVEYDPHVPAPTGGWEPFWPGYYVSTKRLPSGVWRAWATLSPRQRVRVRTTHGSVAISPERPIRFIVELDRLRAGAAPAPVPQDEPEREFTPPFGWSGMRHTELDPYRHDVPETQQPPSPSGVDREAVAARPTRQRQVSASGSGIVGYVYGTLFRQRLLGDRVASNFVAAGVILPLLMAGYLYSQYEGIPSIVPIHWDALGDVDRVVGPRALWRLPVMAVLILLANTFLATLLTAVDRFLARLLAAAIPIAQIITFIALVRAVR